MRQVLFYFIDSGEEIFKQPESKLTPKSWVSISVSALSGFGVTMRKIT